MIDIVKVLRGKYALDYDEKTLDKFCNEAATEIEKLREERDMLLVITKQCRQALDVLRVKVVCVGVIIWLLLIMFS